MCLNNLDMVYKPLARSRGSAKYGEQRPMKLGALLRGAACNMRSIDAYCTEHSAMEKEAQQLSVMYAMDLLVGLACFNALILSQARSGALQVAASAACTDVVGYMMMSSHGPDNISGLSSDGMSDWSTYHGTAELDTSMQCAQQALHGAVSAAAAGAAHVCLSERVRRRLLRHAADPIGGEMYVSPNKNPGCCELLQRGHEHVYVNTCVQPFYDDLATLPVLIDGGLLDPQLGRARTVVLNTAMHIIVEGPNSTVNHENGHVQVPYDGATGKDPLMFKVLFKSRQHSKEDALEGSLERTVTDFECVSNKCWQMGADPEVQLGSPIQAGLSTFVSLYSERRRGYEARRRARMNGTRYAEKEVRDTVNIRGYVYPVIMLENGCRSGGTHPASVICFDPCCVQCFTGVCEDILLWFRVSHRMP